MVAWEATALPLGNTRGEDPCVGELELRRRIVPCARSSDGRSRGRRWRPRAVRFAPVLRRKARLLRCYPGEPEASPAESGGPAAAATRPGPPARHHRIAQLPAPIQAPPGRRRKVGDELPAGLGYPGRESGIADFLYRPQPQSGANRIFS